MNLSIHDLVTNFGCVFISGDRNTICHSFSVDTRTFDKEDCFIALKGENFDGAFYYQKAFFKGAKVVILSKDSNVILENDLGVILLVDDPMELLVSLAKYRRSLYKHPVIAVTGSVGKTSTKEMIYSVLKQKYSILKSEKNYNNLLGVCLTLLKLKEEEILLVELGMNHLNEISLLSKIVKPDIAVITNIGTAHIGNLGSKENILKAKLEILDGMNESGKLLINEDDLYLRKVILPNILKFSIYENSDYKVDSIKMLENGISFTVLNHSYFLPVFQTTYIYNALVALMIGKMFQLCNKEIKTGFSTYQIPSGRGNVLLSKSNIKIMDDTYNASMESVLSSLEVLELQKGRKIFILGDILEIGTYKDSIYRQMAMELEKKKIDVVITIGENELVSKGLEKESYHFTSIEEANIFLKSFLKKDDFVLLKASHGASFQKLVSYIKKL